MTDLQRNRLYKLVDVPKAYNGRNIVIKKVIPQDGFVTIKTDGPSMNFEDHEIDSFLDSLSSPLSPADLVPAQTENNVPAERKNDVQVYSPTAESKELKDLLMATIRGVSDGSVPPDRAKMVFEGSNALVNIQKAELQAIGMLKGRR